ncbi:MMPL family transporter [Kribbella sp. NPDC050820]|uniref:MMPL family transporter n=1 Tax=Kribbella sp. NPDC050820 TaxID=3155408 RepID=UPI0033DF1AD2
MRTVLARIGRAAFRRRWTVIATWLALLVAVLAAAGAVGGSLDNEFTIPGSESQLAQDRLAADFPAAAGTSAQIVFRSADGKPVTESASVEAIRRTLAEVGGGEQVAGVVDPFEAGTISPDRRTALAQVQYDVDRAALHDDALDDLERSATTAEAAGLQVEVGGAAYASDGVSVSVLELLGVLIALVVLTVTFGSLLTAGVPLISALIGVGVGVGALFALTELVAISSTAVTLALMLGLAVGIDYALFIVSRHRRQLAQGMDAEDSAANATATAGAAVVFAGATVVIALVGLAVVRIPFLTVMGLTAAGAVLVGVLVAITLIPAVFGVAGHRLAPKPRSRVARLATGELPPFGERWSRVATARPLMTVLAVVVALVAVAAPATDLRLALPDNVTAPTGSTERRAYDVISGEFGPGFNGPLVLYVGDATAQSAGEAVQQLRALPGVAAVSPPQYNPSTGSAVIQLVPTTAPDDEATADLVERVREQRPDVAVTGTTAVDIDISQRLRDSLLPFLAVVVGLCLVLLLLVFRSLVIPLKAAAGFLLSAGAALGVVVAVFQWGWLADVLGVANAGPVVSFLPIILVAVLFGLAMDYEVFVVSTIHEEWIRTGEARRSIHQSGRHASRVVTAAALIMFSVFAGFATTHDSLIKPIAFALATGVLIDAFVIRMTLVPAVLALTGRWAWWLPGWLDRRLPAVSIEGDPQDSPPQKADSLPVG